MDETARRKNGHSVVVMGVCASGKTTLGKQLAERLGAEFIDGDDLHPAGNVRKMATGQPLNDADRRPWLEKIRDTVVESRNGGYRSVIACSALRKSYRDIIRQGDPAVHFLFLDVDKPTVLDRIRTREGHFMKDTLVDSQFATLERPDGEPHTWVTGNQQSVAEIIDAFLAFDGQAWSDASS